MTICYAKDSVYLFIFWKYVCSRIVFYILRNSSELVIELFLVISLIQNIFIYLFYFFSFLYNQNIKVLKFYGWI